MSSVFSLSLPGLLFPLDTRDQITYNLMNSMKGITVKELAALTGVSPTTVSNVIHGRHRKMRPEVLERVQKALAENNYVSNMAGRLLGNHGSRLIGVIMMYSHRNELNVTQDPFHGEIIGALERRIRDAGYFMMLYTSENVDESLRIAVSWNVEGLIVLGGDADDAARYMRNMDIPIVFIDQYFHRDQFSYINVGLDDRQGGRLMTRYLLDRGHRRIAFLADSEKPVGVDWERLCGCREVLAEYGIAPEDGDFIPISYRQTDRRETFRRLIRDKFHGRTALFFASDFYAVDAMCFFYDQGIRIPGDISIAGFDGNIFSVQCRPRLTTVKQDIPRKAECTVAQLTRLIRKEEITEPNIRLGVSLQDGDSVGDKPISRCAPSAG
jgi:LacI family transcriptional regulator